MLSSWFLRVRYPSVRDGSIDTMSISAEFPRPWLPGGGAAGLGGQSPLCRSLFCTVKVRCEPGLGPLRRGLGGSSRAGCRPGRPPSHDTPADAGRVPKPEGPRELRDAGYFSTVARDYRGGGRPGSRRRVFDVDPPPRIQVPRCAVRADRPVGPNRPSWRYRARLG